MASSTCTTVVAVFNERRAADRAIDDLRESGFTPDSIGVVTRDAQGNAIVQGNVDTPGETDSYAGEAALAGAVAGAGIGGLVGLGVLAGVVPVIGPALAAGTLATILTNVAGGAAITGLGAALIGWGIPEEQAQYYDSQLQAGRVVVTVKADDRRDMARSILESHGGYDHTTPPRTTVRM